MDLQSPPPKRFVRSRPQASKHGCAEILPGFENVAAKMLEDQVTALTSQVRSWQLDDLAERRRRVFGSTSSPAVCKLQQRAMRDILRSQVVPAGDSPSRQGEGASSSAPAPHRQPRKQSAPMKLQAALPTSSGDDPAPFASPMARPVVSQAGQAAAALLHSPLSPEPAEAALPVIQSVVLATGGVHVAADTRPDVDADVAMHAGAQPEAGPGSCTAPASVLGKRRLSLPRALIFQQEGPVDIAWPGAGGSPGVGPPLHAPGPGAGLGLSLPSIVPKATPVPHRTTIGGSSSSSSARKRTWSDLGPQILAGPTGSPGSAASSRMASPVQHGPGGTATGLPRAKSPLCPTYTEAGAAGNPHQSSPQPVLLPAQFSFGGASPMGFGAPGQGMPAAGQFALYRISSLGSNGQTTFAASFAPVSFASSSSGSMPSAFASLGSTSGGFAMQAAHAFAMQAAHATGSTGAGAWSRPLAPLLGHTPEQAAGVSSVSNGAGAAPGDAMLVDLPLATVVAVAPAADLPHHGHGHGS